MKRGSEPAIQLGARLPDQPEQSAGQLVAIMYLHLWLEIAKQGKLLAYANSGSAPHTITLLSIKILHMHTL
jgi:hypothetical protein